VMTYFKLRKCLWFFLPQSGFVQLIENWPTARSLSAIGEEAVMDDMRQGTTTGYRRYGAELGLQRNYRQGLGFADQGTQFLRGRCIA